MICPRCGENCFGLSIDKDHNYCDYCGLSETFSGKQIGDY